MKRNSFVSLFMLMFVLLMSNVAGAAPTSAEITGEIEHLTLNTPGDVYSGGVMIVGGSQVILPKNLLIDLPANRLSLQQIFTQAPAACIALGESGLAKADKCNASGGGGFATLSGVHSTAGNIIAGDVLIEKGKEVAFGVVSYINHTDGYFRVNGITNDPATGVMIRLNDPTSRHTIQQGAGCAGGPNCSADPRFGLDPDNYVIAFSSGYPVCLPSAVTRNFPGLPAIPTSGIAAVAAGGTQSDASGVGDRACPSTNRTPGLVVEPAVNDSRLFAPLVVGDSVNAEGNYEAVNGTRFLSAHTMRVNKALSTKNVAGQPDYLFLEEVFVEAPAFQNLRARMLIIGFSTLPSDVDFWTIHRDPTTNAVHEFPLASIQGCDNAAGAGTCGTLGLGGGGGAGNNIFRIRYDVDWLLAAANDPKFPGGAKETLNPCWQLLNSPRFTVSNPGLCPGGSATGAGITLANNFGIMLPAPHEIQARTGHSLDNPGLVTLDIRGNTATNGQYLFPFGMNLGGTETADFLEVDINLLTTPRVFEGIPWNLDRRLSPSGCLNNAGVTAPCPAGALGTFALDPFPYTGLDPRAQAPGIPTGPYSDPNFTTGILSNASNRVFTYVTATGKANGNATLLPYVLGTFPADPPLIAIVPTPVLNIFPPFADEDSATALKGGPAITINVSANDVAVLGTLDLASVKLPAFAPPSVSGVLPSGATVTVLPPQLDPLTGKLFSPITYLPSSSFPGTADSFTYTIANNFGSVSNQATVNVALQVKPTAVADSASVPARSTITFSLTGNDLPLGSSPLNLASVVFVSPPTCGAAATPLTALGGLLTNNADGDVTFKAPLAVPGIAPNNTCTFSYTVSDFSVPLPLISNVATVTVTITPPVAPIAVDDTFPNATFPALITTGSAVNLPVLFNDVIAPPSVMNLKSVAVTTPTGAITPNSSGTAAAGTDGTTAWVTYTAPATAGTYTFNYTVTDSAAIPTVSNVAKVTVTVTQGHIAPTAVNDSFPNAAFPALITAGSPVTLNVLTNDTATTGSLINPASVAVSVPAGSGSASVDAITGVITYTPPATAGIYTFTYTVKDNFTTPATSNVATVTVTVTAGTATPLAIATVSPLPSYAVGSGLFNGIITATGGTAPYTFFNPVGGTGMPTGISLFPNGQLFGGGATVPGTYTFNVSVLDSLNALTTKAFTLVVTSGPLAISTASPLPSNIIGGGVYNGIINATGGTAPYTFSVTAGALPAGISLFSNGQLFGGGSTVAGTYNFTVTVTDSTLATASQAFTLQVL